MSERQRVLRGPSCTPGRTVVRRKCACGTSTTTKSGSCPACERRRIQPKLVVGAAQDAEEREADRVASAVMGDGAGAVGVSSEMASLIQRSSAESSVARGDSDPEAPAIVDQVLAGPGQALDSGSRRFFESRFRRDFSSVRLHIDSQAAASASAVDAHAYTVGNHIVFGASRYAPETAAGRHLLAHELTHVVQQGAALRRASVSPPVEGHGNDEEEKEQPVRRLRRYPAIVGLEEAGPHADLTGKLETQMYQLSERDKKLAECKKAAGPDPALCDPATPPTWSDFTATPAAGSEFGAETFSFIQGVDVPSQKCEETITGYASGPKKRFQGVFTPDKSWVKSEFSDAADPSKNGSATEVGNCEAHFDKEAAAGHTGVWWALSSSPSKTCPASERAAGNRATKKEECATIVAADFNDRAVRESNRLLKHEQMHLALTCAMAKKGNDLLTAGTSFDKVDAVIHIKLSAAQSLYDGQTQHGCVAANQSTWETAIAAGLPDIKLI